MLATRRGKKKQIKERAQPGAGSSQGEEQEDMEGNALRAGSFHPLTFQLVSKHALLIKQPDSCPGS